MKTSKYLLIFAVSLASFHSFALDVKQRFDHLDKNKNGFLTTDELSAQPQLLKQLNRWDNNGDQQISLIEFKHYLTNKR